MINAELIQKIRTKIEELYSKPVSLERWDMGYDRACEDMMEYLSTLEESEKTMNQEGLEEDLTNEADKMFFSLGFYEGDHHQPMLDAISQEQFRGIARHFAQWGAEHTPLPEDTVLFNKGVEEGKRLMREEAVEGKVFMSFAPGHNQMVMADVDLPTNTKVKIIILKEDEK